MKKIVTITYFLICSILSQSSFSETLRISPELLKQQLSDSKLIILDARSTEAYQAGHIEGAISFPITLTYKNQKVNGKISLPAITQKNFRIRNLSINSQVVVYDNGNLVDAARLFWFLEVYGLTHVKLLDHGYDHWIDKDFPVTIKEPETKPSQYIATINHTRLASKFTTQLATRNDNQLVIDARSSLEYIGKNSSAKRFGHIPSAISIPSSHNFFVDNGFASLKPLDKLNQIYSTIPKNRKVIIYCAVGRISSANYLALRELGYDVSNYDASWNEWGNDFKLPIEK